MRKLSFKIIGFLIVWNQFTHLRSVAQEIDSIPTITLKQVVVTASRSEKEIFDIGRYVTVIDSEEIRNSAYDNVGELLTRQEGIYVVGANQTPGTNQSLFLRGANSNHTSVLIDGLRITDPSSPNSALDLSELSLANVERIEIVRGSHRGEHSGNGRGRRSRGRSYGFAFGRVPGPRRSPVG